MFLLLFLSIFGFVPLCFRFYSSVFFLIYPLVFLQALFFRFIKPPINQKLVRFFFNKSQPIPLLKPYAFKIKRGTLRVN